MSSGVFIFPSRRVLRAAIALCHPLFAGSAFAQGVATEKQLEKIQSVTVTGQRAPLDPNLPNSTASKTQQELREQQNIFNPEDALRNLPNTTIRKRYAGDRNALIGGRSFATSQAPRGLVLMDGYLISNFLGRFDAPRWNMVMPEEMARVDVLYGPFSAIYPGNSIGTTVAITTSQPKGFEASARIAAQFQSFDEYGLKDTYNNYQVSGVVGNRLAKGAWYRMTLNRQDSTSQPMQYFGINANALGVFVPPTGTGTATPVIGVIYDTGPNGLARAIFGANAGAIDHTIQHTAKLRGGFNISPTLALEGFAAVWKSDTTTRNVTFLRDAAGNHVYAGRVSNGGNVFSIPNNAFAPFTRDEEHMQWGATLKTRHATGWNHSIVTSYYEVLGDVQRTANNPDPVAAAGGAGIGLTRDGTRWRTFEVQSTYTPFDGDWTSGKHALTFGIHANDYRLQQTTSALADWRTSSGQTRTQYVGGDTRLFALYAQDAFRFAPEWALTSGLRWEDWKSENGSQQFIPGPSVAFESRTFRKLSPKLSLSWDVQVATTLRASVGRGYRFATVSELFAGSQSGNTIVIADPSLQPEKSDAMEFTVDQRFKDADVRVSLFQDDVRNTILSQTNILVFPAVTNVQNIDRVRTRGIEIAGGINHLGMQGLRVEANIAWNRSRILENEKFPASVGKNWIRVPRVRSAITAIYKPTPVWSVATTYRYQGRQWNELNNSDINPDVYAGLSRVRQWDARLLWNVRPGAEVSVGVDNITNKLAWQSHPFPGRTLFVEGRMQF
jgi:iron complex outermembrane recepter protein